MKLLLAASHAVVMDLREFQQERQGCRIELEALARLPTPRPVVLVTDATSDVPLIRDVLTQAGAHPDAPPWHFVTCSSREGTTVRRVLQALA